MEKGELNQLIERKNRQTTGDVRRVFAKKASDAQMLDKLAASARAVLEEWDRGGGTGQAFAELRKDVALAERRRK